MLTKTAKQECNNRRFDFTHYAGRIQERDMFRLLKPLTLGLSVIGSIGVYSLTVAASASAFTLFDGSKTLGLSASDVGKEFTIDFNGNVSTKDVTGLSSEAIFKFLGLNRVGSNTEAIFDVSLTNNSSNGITSRTSALGFDVWNFNGASLGSTLNLIGVGNASGSGNTRVEAGGLFSKDRSGSFPNQFGDIDVCFTDGNTCQGGSNGGVSTGETGKFKATIALSGDVKTFAMNNFGVRYQSINGETFAGASGTGRGTIDIGVPPENPTQIPEPTMTTALLLVGLGTLRYGKKKPETLIQTEG
ncbi:cistern family PEP-CTERM protein [Laspinema olomoucense]|uniref:cistern family PEP-CTERM protein n=1 Tax=Laspinema olomoucense TaxID=3231600 RepID=UPI0021BB0A41|nr:cistern family PEP-CTERM protein [Laspinema sp. D3a]MCT7989431.1 cistern family PEP-CTERM protein [Laspinema sp. D3a]